MPAEPSFPSSLPPVAPIGGAGASRISLEPASRLPAALQETQMQTPQSGTVVGALAKGVLSQILQGLKGPVTLPTGQTVDPETFQAIVSSSIVPTNPP